MTVHVLRIPKAASSALVKLLDWYMDVHIEEPSDHSFRLRDVPEGELAFAVVRDPVDRFRSAYDQYRYSGDWDVRFGLRERFASIDDFVDAEEWEDEKYGYAFWPQTYWLESAEYARARGAIVMRYETFSDDLVEMGFDRPERTHKAMKVSEVGPAQQMRLREYYADDYTMLEELSMASKQPVEIEEDIVVEEVVEEVPEEMASEEPEEPVTEVIAEAVIEEVDYGPVDAWMRDHTDGLSPHLQTLMRLVKGAGVVVEFGTGRSSSSWAILDAMASDGTLVSVDNSTGDKPVDIAPRVENDPRFSFVAGDSTEVDLPEKIDILFRDSTDDGDVIYRELERGHDHGAWRIISHDWMEHDGLRAAIDRFVTSYPEWSVDGHEDVGYGLVWLRRS